jgi:hypothetical protein
MSGKTRFEVDGVTGWLRIDTTLGSRVERIPALAVIKGGKAIRTDVVR